MVNELIKQEQYNPAEDLYIIPGSEVYLILLKRVHPIG